MSSYACQQVLLHPNPDTRATLEFICSDKLTGQVDLGVKTKQQFVQILTARLEDRIKQPCEQYGLKFVELPLIQGTLNYTEQIVHCIQYETCIISSLVRKNSDIISSVSSRSLSRPQWLPRKEERSQALWIIYLKLCGIPPSCPVMGRMQSLLS